MDTYRITHWTFTVFIKTIRPELPDNICAKLADELLHTPSVITAMEKLKITKNQAERLYRALEV